MRAGGQGRVLFCMSALQLPIRFDPLYVLKEAPGDQEFLDLSTGDDREPQGGQSSATHRVARIHFMV